MIIPWGVGGLLLYDGAGTGSFWRTYGQGQLAEINTHNNWESTGGRPWTHIVPIANYTTFDEIHPTWVFDLLFYDRAGTGALYRTKGQGRLEEVKTYTGWRSSWNQIIPVWLNHPKHLSVGLPPSHGLLFYDDDGTGEFYSYDGGRGELTRLTTYTDWGPGLQIIALARG